MRAVATRALDGDPVRIAAPTVLEVAYGLEHAALSGARVRRYLSLLDRCIGDGTLRVVPLDARAAFVAGRVRARAPHAPARVRGERRSRSMRQAAWLLDIQIAATAFAGGLQVVTANRSDFEQIGALLATMFPASPELRVDPMPT
jgi:predicted nucleic acid-binding protein